MNNSDAYKLLVSELTPYRALSYSELTHLIGASPLRVVTGDDSTRYSVQVTLCWRGREHGDILVQGWIAVDECGPLQRMDEQFIVIKPRD